MIPNPIDRFPLLQALRSRRSRRFARGMTLPEGGPLDFQSRSAPAPLSLDEEALLAFAACGITGPALSDLSLGRGQGGNIMLGLVGRTIASGDAAQSVALIVTNDEGTYLIRCPRDHSAHDLAALVRAADEGRFNELYQRSRVRIADDRCEAPKEPIFNLAVNRWCAGAPGTTSFIPINDLSRLYINGLLDVFNEETGCFLLDERAGFRPAGIGRFARSRGGHLEDDPRGQRLATVQRIELIVAEVVAIEQGMMLQNLALMCEAMGLGGFPSFAEHEFGWFEALGFRMEAMPALRALGGGRWRSRLATLIGKNPPIPIPVGLERDGEVLLSCYGPPYFKSMKEAVLAVIDEKHGTRGLRPRADATAWKSGDEVTAAIPRVSERAIEATIACCEYLHERYGRFPVTMAPFRTVLRFQAAHLDLEFYRKYYRPEAIPKPFLLHEEHWHESVREAAE